MFVATKTRLVVRQGTVLQRQFGISAVVANKAVDPIQKLFLDKLNEYKVKSKYVFSIYHVFHHLLN